MTPPPLNNTYLHTQSQPEYGDEQVDAGRDCRTRLARPDSQARTNGDREIFIFPVQLTTGRIGNLTRLILFLLYVMTIHTYIAENKTSEIKDLFSRKAAINTIVPRSPFFVFCTPKYCRLQKYNIMRYNVCVNEMAPFGPFAAFIKGCITFYGSGRKGGQPVRQNG